jgi:TatA/E family protein of Tat protein translocase
VLPGLENPVHILFIVVIAMLVFGPSQLPKIARRAGRHAREAKHGIAQFKDEFEAGMDDSAPAEEVVHELDAAQPRETALRAAKIAGEGD